MLPKHTKFVSELSNFLKPREHLPKNQIWSLKISCTGLSETASNHDGYARRQRVPCTMLQTQRFQDSCPFLGGHTDVLISRGSYWLKISGEFWYEFFIVGIRSMSVHETASLQIRCSIRIRSELPHYDEGPQVLHVPIHADRLLMLTQEPVLLNLPNSVSAGSSRNVLLVGFRERCHGSGRRGVI